MGLFSFIKSAGKKILKTKESTPGSTDARTNESLLKQSVIDLGLGVRRFAIHFDEETVTVYGEVNNSEDAEKIVLALGNVDGVCHVEDRLDVLQPDKKSEFYEVKAGDTLSKISKQYYGDPMKYNMIFEANRPMLSHPDKIYPGQVLRIPIM